MLRHISFDKAFASTAVGGSYGEIGLKNFEKPRDTNLNGWLVKYFIS